ncbi:MAG: UDP-N-acetylglucosamine--N-acetylmuramyl-(pentapeptide) pyrophosphoryl-undecaprenol N-acetylglucosamine transferase [Chloroflexota bacterium]|nr:UDP-N-acetylglucosamine--N-acetylmuramyl-(pentapeptide) pyrophosphoryl-undecaprenol N-acetylglucosamine transferase [Chloroflexota bacterium]
MSPLLAVAEAVRERDADARFLFLGGRRGLEAELVAAAGIPFHATPMPSLRDPDSRASLASRGALLVPALVDALTRVVRFGPRACCTSGGLVSLPIVAAARAARVPVYLWEGNVVPGRVNRLLAGWSQRVGATFAASVPALPRGRTRVSGDPIRASLLRWTAAEGRAALGLVPGPVVLVGGGSQGSGRINEALLGALPQILRAASVVHLAGGAHIGRAEARKATLPADLAPRYHPHAFLRDEMGAALAAADIVVGRAGASSISEALAFGKPLVLIPFGASASAHQAANARAVEEAGAAAVIREGQLDGERLAAVVVGLLNDAVRVVRMASAAKAMGRPDAAAAIAQELLALGGCA